MIGGALLVDLLEGLSGTETIDSDVTGYTHDLWIVVDRDVMFNVQRQIDDRIQNVINSSGASEDQATGVYSTANSYSFAQAHWVFAGAMVSTVSSYSFSWHTVYEGGTSYIEYEWTGKSTANFSDDFHDAAAFGEKFGREFENDLVIGTRYFITHEWKGIVLKGKGIIE